MSALFRHKLVAGAVVAGACLAVSAVASAQTSTNVAPLGHLETSDVGDWEPAETADPAPHHFLVDGGPRGLLSGDAGFDPYSDSNYLVQASAAASWFPFRFGNVRVGASAQYSVGSLTGQARGDAATLRLQQGAFGVHARFDAGSRLQLFTRVMPGFADVVGEVEDGGLLLVSRDITWTLDTSAGASLRLGSAGEPDNPAASFWINAELGYSFAGRAEMAYSAELEDDDPRQFGAITLPAVKPAGFMNRLSFGVSF